MMDIKNAVVTCLLYLSFIFVIMALITALWWIFYPYKTVEFSKFNITNVAKRPYDLGYVVSASWEFDKYIDKPAEYYVNLIPLQTTNSLRTMYTVESGMVNTPLGHTKTSKSVRLSEEVPPGKYKVIAVLIYHVNPIRSIKKTFVSENYFEIKQR
jgi:hypothetical protein